MCDLIEIVSYFAYIIYQNSDLVSASSGNTHYSYLVVT